jgi:hypothetical protein
VKNSRRAARAYHLPSAGSPVGPHVRRLLPGQAGNRPRGFGERLYALRAAVSDEVLVRGIWSKKPLTAFTKA